MSKAPTGEKIVVKVGALADPNVRAVPATKQTVIGTSTGYQIGETEVESREFGVAATLWDDGSIVARNWQAPLQTNYRPEEAGNALLEDKALTDEEIYVEIYPFGSVSGQPYFYGYVTVNGFNAGWPRDGAMTASMTLKGRGALTKATVV